MAKLAHITHRRASSSTPMTGSLSEELLDAYSSWLFFERHFLHIGRFGVERAVDLINTVEVDNVGAMFHLPLDVELPDYSAPARRAGLVLSRVGLKVQRPHRGDRGSLLKTTLTG